MENILKGSEFAEDALIVGRRSAAVAEGGNQVFNDATTVMMSPTEPNVTATDIVMATLASH